MSSNSTMSAHRGSSGSSVSSGLSSFLPERLRAVLALRATASCPERVKAIVASISSLTEKEKGKAKEPVSVPVSNRFAHIQTPSQSGWNGVEGGSGDAWVSRKSADRRGYGAHGGHGGHGSHGSHGGHSNASYGGSRGSYGGGGSRYGASQYRRHDSHAKRSDPEPPKASIFALAREEFLDSSDTIPPVVSTAPTLEIEEPKEAPVQAPIQTPVKEAPVESPLKDEMETPVVAFSSAALRAGATVEERMLTRAKGKLNRMGFSNYDATKSSMQQMMSSDNLEFLDEIMDFMFQKAATNSAISSLYAKLIHELADEFPHFRTVVIKLFREYTDIFHTSKTSSDEISSTETKQEVYNKLVEKKAREKYRRGYSQFVGELAKIGEIDVEGFAVLLQTIVESLEVFHVNPEQDKLVCEEYIDCLNSMCTAASGLLLRSSWSLPLKSRIQAMAAKPRTELVGFSIKARFALMNLSDFAERGWK